MARFGWLALLALALLHVPSVAASNHGPAIESADPAPGSYTMAGAGGFPVEVECADDPDGDDVFVDFIANGQVVEVDEDLWGFSPSYTFELRQAGSHALQARCRDDTGGMGSPSTATWTVQVAGQASSPPATNPPPSGTSGFDQVDPAPGAYALQGVGQFEVEIECRSNDGVSVDFVADGEVVETDTDFWGVSPSYAFFLVQSGSHALEARCRSAAGVLAQAQWTVTLPSASSTVGLLPGQDGCLEVMDPEASPAASGEPGQVQDLLLANADLWHRTGPWTCELAALAEPVGLAYDVDSTLVAVKQELDSWSVFDYSAWDVVADVAPQVVPLWSFFEAALPVLEACATALEGVEAFAAIRTASVTFLANPTETELAALHDAIVQAMPAYESWVAAFDLAADKVAEIAAYLTQIAQAFLAAAQELAAGSDFPFRDSFVDGLTFLGDLAVDWSDLVQAWADGIRHLADPVRSDLQVMADLLDPPSPSGVGTPVPSLPWLLLALAAAFALSRRR